MDDEPENKAIPTLIVIPAFNEKGRVGRVVAGVRLAAPFATVLVVDDASSDATAMEAKKAGARVIRHPVNLGYGAAHQTGLLVAKAENFSFVIQMDGDGQHDPGSMAGLLNAVRKGGADLAIGSRFLGKGSYRAPILRRIGMFIFGRIASRVLGRPLSDPTSGFVALGPRAVSLFCHSEHYPADFPDADVIIMAHRAGLSVTEVPVVMHQSPPGKKSMHHGLTPLYYVFKMFLCVFLSLIRKKTF